MSGTRAVLVTGLTALAVLSGCAGEAAGPPATVASTRPADEFGPAGFGKLTLAMTEQQARATGDLGPSPVSVASGCRDYSFADGPAPDPARMAKDADLEKRYQAAEKAADAAGERADRPLRRNASAQEYAESARRSADSAQAISKALTLSAETSRRAAERTAAFTRAGGASFAKGKLRVLMAPAKARTAAGISRGSTAEQIRAAYAAQGLTSSSSDRLEVPDAGGPGWTLAFNMERNAVAAMMLINKKAACA